MRARACAAVLLAWCLAPPQGARASVAARPVVMASLELRDGRIVHHVRVMSDEPDGVVVRADEGLVKVIRSDLPPSLAGSAPTKPAAPRGMEMVMQAFNPDQVVEAPRDEAPKPARVPVPDPGKVYKGCSIISFKVKVFQTLQGCAEVVIHNDTDARVELRPGDFVCLTAEGARHAGHNIITDAFPPSIKRREFIPPHEDVVDIVTFANDALDITAVRWAR